MPEQIEQITIGFNDFTVIDGVATLSQAEALASAGFSMSNVEIMES